MNIPDCRLLILSECLDLPEYHLIRALAIRINHVTLVVREDTSKADSLSEQGVQVVRLPFNGRFDLRTIVPLRRLLREERFDIAHCLRNNRPLANLLPASIGMNLCRVAYRGTSGHLSRWDPGSWLSYLNPGVQRLVCVSDAVKAYLLSLGIPEARLTRIYKGHDVNWYAGQPSPDLAEFGIPEGAFTVCCAANFRPVKGVDILLHAMKLIANEPSIHLLLVGEVRDQSIFKLVSDNNLSANVHFAGYRTDAVGIAGACSLCVMPSVKREGLPRSVLESMAQGVPAVVSDVGGMPELVEHGKSGLVVPPGDPRALADAVLRMAKDHQFRREAGEWAKKRIESEFSIGNTVERTLAMYASILSERHSGH